MLSLLEGDKESLNPQASRGVMRKCIPPHQVAKISITSTEREEKKKVYVAADLSSVGDEIGKNYFPNFCQNTYTKNKNLAISRQCYWVNSIYVRLRMQTWRHIINIKEKGTGKMSFRQINPST